MLELRDITKVYRAGENSTQVLNGISIKFSRNEFTSILGPSGCGKTTLLNIIGGLDRYTEGDLLIDGISTKRYHEPDWDSYRNYRVGFIFQSYNLIMHQSVLENVEMALTLSGVSKGERKKKATEVLKRVGLGNQISKKPNQLSGGQMQRVAIARALVNDPDIILADEPTGALDSKTSVQIMELLKEIAADKLVIMVTHNPDIAKTYSTRIIELKDGLVVSDSNPVTEETKETTGQKTGRTSMSLLTALSLSFKNLMTKKGRTFLTAFAGSIGIIGIALILSLSNGVSLMTKQMEKEALSDYPITIERTSFDLFGALGEIISTTQNMEQEACEAGKICSTDDVVYSTVVSSDLGLIKHNDLKEFKKYVDSTEAFREYAGEIDYKYNFNLQVFTKDYNKVVSAVSPETEIFREISSDQDRLNSTYELLAGKMAEKENELMLVIGSEGSIPDSLVYALGIKSADELAEDLKKIAEDSSYRVKSVSYSPEDFLKLSYKLILNTDYYEKDGSVFADRSLDQSYMKKVIDNGMDIQIVGVVKDEVSSESYVGYTKDLTTYVIEQIAKTDIAKKQLADPEINVLSGERFDGISSTFENLCQELGIYELDDPSSISFYPKDYEAKEKLVALIDEYNAQKEAAGDKAGVISYSDMMKNVLGGISNVVNIISYVLIAFVAISLIVSSIMIGIITYISVLERTKEIGILRAIGASRKDITRVFRAETIIEGLVAGGMGIIITLLINVVANSIFSGYMEHGTIAALPWLAAVILILLSVVLNVIAGSIPSHIAASKDPVEALRTE